MKVYVLHEHWEITNIFVNKELAEERLEKRREGCSYCTKHGEADSKHSLEVVEAE